MKDALDVLSDLWPIFVAVIALVFWLAKSYSDIESLKKETADLGQMKEKLTKCKSEIKTLKGKVKVLYKIQNKK